MIASLKDLTSSNAQFRDQNCCSSLRKFIVLFFLFVVVFLFLLLLVYMFLHGD